MRLQLVRLLLHMQIMENVLEFLAKVNNMLIAQTRNTPAQHGCVSQCLCVCVCVQVSVPVCACECGNCFFKDYGKRFMIVSA